MKTRCPHCRTEYDVDPDILRQAHGMARCFHCGQVFDTFTNADQRSSPQPIPVARLIEADIPERDEIETVLPFELSNDVPPLKISSKAALDADDTLGPRRRKGTPGWQSVLALLLLIVLTAQAAWWWRSKLLTYPALQPLTTPLCQWLDCRQPLRRAPQAFGVVERRLELSRDHAHAMRLMLRLRNDARFPQPLPRLVLSLLDRNGTLLARRLLQPSDYLFPAPLPEHVVQPGEAFTIDLLLEDPGQLATSFSFDMY